ncbi:MULTISPECIES: class I lanthipeptide [Hymenobacter]|uniref:Uncharacterized protein n=2 Tax=Hymenobacter TaxID=89966 RepID=W8EZN3_9BACT|nr:MULTISPECIES: class I lanthipeptide [Hymenobacter]AHJ95796.1 hypothetical protein Hsw_0201 [Hymenobacter swuensis DY53]RSK42767.1 hypothetical protein EI293_13280 [Hymenobacter perfusus]
MKKKSISLDKSLSLDKETVAKLNEDQLGDVVGGGTTNTCNNVPAQELEAIPTIGSCQACSCNGG